MGVCRSCRAAPSSPYVVPYMRPPDILLEEEEAIPCDSDASQIRNISVSLPPSCSIAVIICLINPLEA